MLPIIEVPQHRLAVLASAGAEGAVRGESDGVAVVGRKPDTAHPVRVTFVLDGVLALSQGVPQLDGLVSAGRHDLPVVSRESHGEDVLGVVLEPAGGLPGAQIPQTETLVPGARQSEMAIRG